MFSCDGSLHKYLLNPILVLTLQIRYVSYMNDCRTLQYLGQFSFHLPRISLSLQPNGETPASSNNLFHLFSPQKMEEKSSKTTKQELKCLKTANYLAPTRSILPLEQRLKRHAAAARSRHYTPAVLRTQHQRSSHARSIFIAATT